MDELAEGIIRTALEAADPGRALARAWVEVRGAWRVVAFGKASREMLSVARARGEGRITRGVIATDRPELCATPSWLSAWRADHPLPTAHNLAAAEAIAGCVRACSPEETLVALVSGGGSAHLASPAGAITLDDLVRLSSFLMRAGATIHELNTVRRHVERYKGGRLAAMCAARAIEVYVLSDVMGDALHDIASGPFAPDPTTYAQALRVLEGYGAMGVSSQITRHVQDGAMGRHDETPKGDEAVFARVRHHVIASHRRCLDAIATMLSSRGVTVREVRSDAAGEASAWAAWLVERARSATEQEGPCAWLIGGEPVVRVGGLSGRGGPSQEVALVAAKALSGMAKVRLVAFSTDGVDGPSGNAGAVVDGASWERAKIGRAHV